MGADGHCPCRGSARKAGRGRIRLVRRKAAGRPMTRIFPDFLARVCRACCTVLDPCGRLVPARQARVFAEPQCHLQMPFHRRRSLRMTSCRPLPACFFFRGRRRPVPPSAVPESTGSPGGALPPNDDWRTRSRLGPRSPQSSIRMATAKNTGRMARHAAPMPIQRGLSEGMGRLITDGAVSKVDGWARSARIGSGPDAL
jgi:hypothetical protein